MANVCSVTAGIRCQPWGIRTRKVRSQQTQPKLCHKFLLFPPLLSSRLEIFHFYSNIPACQHWNNTTINFQVSNFELQFSQKNYINGEKEKCLHTKHISERTECSIQQTDKQLLQKISSVGFLFFSSRRKCVANIYEWIEKSSQNTNTLDWHLILKRLYK
jgi:hypothetical protein